MEARMTPNDRVPTPEFDKPKLNAPTGHEFTADWLEALTKYRVSAIVIPPKSRPREINFR